MVLFQGIMSQPVSILYKNVVYKITVITKSFLKPSRPQRKLILKLFTLLLKMDNDTEN